MSARKARRQAVATDTSTPPCAERLDAEREKVFKAMPIIDVSRAACQSAEVGRDPEIMTYALQAAYDILDEAVGGLQVLKDKRVGVTVAGEEAS